MPKNWCFWTVVLEKTLESPLDCKKVQPVHPKGNQSWIFSGRTDAEDETLILWPPDVKNWFIWKDPDAGKDWMWEEKGTTEDEMVGWHHWLNGHEFESTPGVGDGWEAWRAVVHGVAKSHTWLSDWTELNWEFLKIPRGCQFSLKLFKKCVRLPPSWFGVNKYIFFSCLTIFIMKNKISLNNFNVKVVWTLWTIQQHYGL